MKSALLALSLVACADEPLRASNPCAAFAGPGLLARRAATHLAVVGVAPRYEGGRMSAVSLDSLDARPLAIEATGDTVVRTLGDSLALLHRAIGDQDNLTLFDPTGARPACQVSLVSDAEERASPRSRPYANAHDVLAVDASHLWVARWNLPSLAVVDLTTGSISRTIDLSAFRGRAALPNPDALALVDGEVWVTLQRLDDLTRPTQRGLIVRLDASTGATLGSIELRSANPTGPMHRSPDGRARLIAASGSYNVVGDGAVEVVDVASRAALDPWVTESELMGNIDAIAVVDDQRLALRVTALRKGTGDIDDLRVVLLHRATRPPITLARMSQWGAAAPVVAGARIFVSDPGDGPLHARAGLLVFAVDGTAIRNSPLSLGPGLMPYDLQPM